MKWLTATTPADTPQAAALRLILRRRLGRPEAVWEPLPKGLLARRNVDGGWGQAKGMTSDAYMTVQVLYALAEAGRTPDAPEVRTAREFLLKTQDEDGSWEIASRPDGPGGKTANNLVPITHAGSAWAVPGLVRSAPPATKYGAAPRPAKCRDSPGTG